MYGAILGMRVLSSAVDMSPIRDASVLLETGCGMPRSSVAYAWIVNF